MKKVTLKQLQCLDEDRLSDYIKLTLESSTNKDLYLDKLTTGQFMVSFGEYPLGVYDSFDDAKLAYFAKRDHI